jgi:hypothetical protein
MNSALKGFLNFLGGLTGGNNNTPDVPLPIEDKAPETANNKKTKIDHTTSKAKPAVKKAAPKKAAPKKKED